MSPSKSRGRVRTSAVVLVALAAARAPTAAHDVWLEPASFVPQVGSRVAVELKVGERFDGRSVPRDPERFERFEAIAIGNLTERPGLAVDGIAIDGSAMDAVGMDGVAIPGVAIPGVAGVSPAGVFEPRFDGTHLIVYATEARPTRLAPEKFESYLEEEGLEHVVAYRQLVGEHDRLGRELYSRCAKSLVGPAGAGFDRRTDMKVEFVPELDPRALRLGDELPLRLLLDGRPLAGALVQAMSKVEPEFPIAVRSDSEGRVRLRLDRPGPWLIKTVHMERIDDVEAEWRSWWASLTFLGPAATSTASFGR